MPDEYISREAALKALFAPGMCYAPMQLQIIKDLPAADVAEVVRCKYCRHLLMRTMRSGHTPKICLIRKKISSVSTTCLITHPPLMPWS